MDGIAIISLVLTKAVNLEVLLAFSTSLLLSFNLCSCVGAEHLASAIRPVATFNLVWNCFYFWGLPRRFALEDPMFFFFRAKSRIRLPEVENAITLKRLKVET